MATEEEAVTLSQFKVWAGKQGGEGGASSQIDVLMDAPASSFTVPGSVVGSHVAFVAEFTDFYGKTQYIAFSGETSEVFTGMNTLKVANGADGALVVSMQQGATSTNMSKIYGIKEW